MLARIILDKQQDLYKFTENLFIIFILNKTKYI